MVGGALYPAAGVEEVVEATPVDHPRPLHDQMLTDPVTSQHHLRLRLRLEVEAVTGELPHVDDGGSQWELQANIMTHSCHLVPD